jgi:steroid delta-isomerase-like uncharacterized protein
MSRDLELVEQWVDAVNFNDWARLSVLFADEVVSWASPSGPGAKPLVAREEIQANSDRFYRAWPDTKLEIERLFGADGWVCLQAELVATHSGTVTLRGGPAIAPTNRSIRVPVVIVFRVDQGKITHKEEYYDSATWWRQMGVDPPSVPILMDLTTAVDD